MKTSAFLLGCILLLSPWAAAFAVELPQPVLVPIDTLQETLYKANKSKSAARLKKAYESYRARDYKQAHELARGLQSEGLFSDYGYWLAANSDRLEAAKALEIRGYHEAARLAERSITETMQTELKNPYSSLTKSAPKEIAQAELILGEANWGLKKWKPARFHFERGFQRLAAHGGLDQITPAQLQRFAEACSHKPSDDRESMCIAWIQRFSNMYTKNSEELKAVAKFFPSANERAKPPQAIGKATQTYKAPDLDLTAFESAMSYYLDEKYGQAISQLRKFLDEYPKSTHRFRARYWLAQALIHEQDHDKAQKILEDLQRDTPLSYYGLLASLATGKNPDSFIEGTLPSATSTDPFLYPQELFRLKRAESLIAEGAYDLASVELKEFRIRDQLSSPFLVYLAALNFETRNFNNAFQILGELIQRGHESMRSSYTLRMIFPVQYLELVQKYSTENKLDPILVLSLIKQESAFDQSIASGAGAAGLMQLMPATAADTEPEIKRSDLTDAESNIRVGTKYLKKLLTRFNGNIVLALAGYNAGPNAADRWFRDAPQKRGMLEFIETIPYRETREYVASIMRNYFWYSRRLNGDGPKNLSYFWNSNGSAAPASGDEVKPAAAEAKAAQP